MSADETLVRGGLERCAVFLLAIGEERAAKVMRHLDVREVRSLSAAMAAMRSVSMDKVAAALEQFSSRTRSGVVAGSSEYLRKVLTEALGKRQGEAMLAKIVPSSSDSLEGIGAGLSNLKWMDARSITELMRNEHPQVVAMILALLDSDQAGEVVGMLPEDLAYEALERMATIGSVQPGALRELAEALNEQSSGNQDALNMDSFGGVETTAEVLNRLDAKRAERMLGRLKESDPDLAEKVEDLMFVFSDLIDLDDRGMQVLLREVESSTLLIAIRGTSEELRDKIFHNMSKRAAEILQDDLEAHGPVRLHEVEMAQKEILRAARNLAEQGQLTLKSGSEEMV